MGNKVLERLAAERTHTNELIDEILADCRGRRAQPVGVRARADRAAQGRARRARDRRSSSWPSWRSSAAESRDVHALLNRAGTRDRGRHRWRPPVGARVVVHRRRCTAPAGQFVVDYLKSRGGMRDDHGQIAAP